MILHKNKNFSKNCVPFFNFEPLIYKEQNKMKNKSEKGDSDMNKRRLDKNDLLKKFDTDELLEYLNGIIDNEIKKSDGINSDIIDECVDWILELKGVKIELSEDEIKRRVNFITKKYYSPKKKKLRFVYVATIIVFMIFCIQIVSITAFSFDFFDWTKDSFLTLIGIEDRKDDKSFLSSGAKEYKTVEELEKAENIDIIVPYWLPGDIEMKFIIYSFEYTKKQVDIIYDDTITTLSIRLNSMLPNIDDAEVYENNNIIFYIIPDENIMTWEYDGNFYNFTCGFDVTEYVEEIIKNIK